MKKLIIILFIINSSNFNIPPYFSKHTPCVSTIKIRSSNINTPNYNLDLYATFCQHSPNLARVVSKVFATLSKLILKLLIIIDKYFNIIIYLYLYDKT